MTWRARSFVQFASATHHILRFNPYFRYFNKPKTDAVKFFESQENQKHPFRGVWVPGRFRTLNLLIHSEALCR